MSGVSTNVIQLSRRPGLVVIDAQRIFLDPASPACVMDAENVAGNLARLTEGFRSAGLPVLFTRHLEPASGPRGTNPLFFPRPLVEHDPLSALTPRIHDLAITSEILVKDRHDAFSHGLPESLTGTGILFLAGVRTGLCVLSTALGLARHRIVPVVVADACADRHPAIHEAALRCLSAGHAHVRTTGETLHLIASLEDGADGE